MTRAAAFFDMDGTVITRNTGPLYVAYAYRHGWLRKRQMLEGAMWSLMYKLTLIDTERVARRAMGQMAGVDERELIELCDRWVEAQVLPRVSRAGRRVMEMHRSRGDLLVLLTASSPYAAEPVGRHLRMDHVLCSRLEVKQGMLTGLPVEPPCIGQGKVFWAKRLALEEGIDLGRSSFYTDSVHDLPMLLEVGRPVIVNPDFRLARRAQAAGWRVEQWS